MGGPDSPWFILFVFAELLDYINVCLSPNVGRLQPLCLQICFVRRSSSSLFGTPVT